MDGNLRLIVNVELLRLRLKVGGVLRVEIDLTIFHSPSTIT